MILNDIIAKRNTVTEPSSRGIRGTGMHIEGVDMFEPQYVINCMHMTPDDSWLFLSVKKVSDYMSNKNESYICAYDLSKGKHHKPLVKLENCDGTTGVYACKNPENGTEIFLFTVCDKGTVRRYSVPSLELVREYRDLHNDYVLRILGNGEYVITGGSRGTLTVIEIKTGNIICHSRHITSHA
jgi:WD40 repeat protein